MEHPSLTQQEALGGSYDFSACLVFLVSVVAVLLLTLWLLTALIWRAVACGFGRKGQRKRGGVVNQLRKWEAMNEASETIFNLKLAEPRNG